jgi:membrane-associated phospholipid phosphatase
MSSALTVRIIQFFTWSGNLIPQIFIIISLLIIDFEKGYQVAWIWFWGYAINLILKNTIKKARPNKALWRIPHVNGHSFPSGHSLTSLVLYWSIARVFEIEAPLVYIFYTWPFLLGLSRLYLRVHHLEDVVCGWIIAYMYLLWMC